MNVSIPPGQKCQNTVQLGRCGKPAEYGLVAQPGGGLVMYVCGDCVDYLAS